jgi:large subunit ribosomal protein L7/L12
MADVTRDQVKDFLKNMSLMDAAALVKELETELGVSAAAPVAVAAAAPAGGGAAAACGREGRVQRRPHRRRREEDPGHQGRA